MLESYPEFYSNSLEFNEILAILQIEIGILWIAYYLFVGYVVMNGVNPSVSYSDIVKILEEAAKE